MRAISASNLCRPRRDAREEEIDIVDICLPTYRHAEATIQACKAGKHVVCEKPMARSLEEADAMISAAKEQA